jgi:hypothetical protein
VIQIDFPKHLYKIKTENNNDFIYDTIRRGWFLLTPEEWVRQNIIQYLTTIKKYPPKLIAIEKEIKVGELKKRFDIVIYKDDNPWMIVECKQMDIKLDEKTLQQILTYQSKVQAVFLAITNGNSSYLLQKINNHFIAVSAFPEWI